MAKVLITDDNRAFGMGLVDMRLPGGPDGEAMRKLAHRFPGLPLLVITGHSQLAPPVAHAGFFAKPFSTPSLLDSIERIYASRRT